MTAFAQQYECICFEGYMAGCVFPLSEPFVKLPFACILKPSTAKSGSHIVNVLSLCVDGYVIGSSLSTKVSAGGTLLALLVLCV